MASNLPLLTDLERRLLDSVYRHARGLKDEDVSIVDVASELSIPKGQVEQVAHSLAGKAALKFSSKQTVALGNLAALLHRAPPAQQEAAKGPTESATEKPTHHKATAKRAGGASQEAQRDLARMVYVVHGRNTLARDAMDAFLKRLGITPVYFEKAITWTGQGNPHPCDVIKAAFDRVGAVLVLLSGDDLACLKPDYVRGDDPDDEKSLTPQARPNVLFEAGFAYSLHNDRTILVQVGKLRGLSDLLGLHIPRMKNTKAFREDLVARLRTAQCDIRKKKGWKTAGDFDAAVKQGTEPLRGPTHCHALRVLTGKWNHTFETLDPQGRKTGPHPPEAAEITPDGVYRGNQTFQLDMLQLDERARVLTLEKRRPDGRFWSLEVLTLSRNESTLEGFNNEGCRMTYTKV
ncbi:MAG: hypothetical protein FJ291_13980 [Planctomycetes bacterium]|nr:hypothetical protein [Planctomycetota bacterium]